MRLYAAHAVRATWVLPIEAWQVPEWHIKRVPFLTKRYGDERARVTQFESNELSRHLFDRGRQLGEAAGAS
jgi:hypothetical protein